MSRSRIRILPWVWHPTNFVSSWLLRLLYKVEVRPSRRLPTAPVLIAAKHASGWDIPAMAWQVYARLGLHGNFQMGSFVGYTVLGRIVPLMRICGGFPVMRPKEILRLRERRRLTKDEATRIMSEVNDEAEATRREILEKRQALVFFPEGTRDNDRVRPIRGTHEIDTALSAAAEGSRVEVWPVMLRYGTRGFRPRLRIEFAEPFEVNGLSAESVAERIHAAFVATWDDVPPPAGR